MGDEMSSAGRRGNAAGFDMQSGCWCQGAAAPASLCVKLQQPSSKLFTGNANVRTTNWILKNKNKKKHQKCVKKHNINK